MRHTDAETLERSSGFHRRRMLLLALAAAVACFVYLGSYPLLDPDEGRYAEISREMLESGNFVTPTLNYVDYPENPPGFYWLVSGTMALLGVNEWGARTGSALAGFLTVLLLVALGRRMLAPGAGVLAGWVYLTSLLPLALMRMPTPDALFTLFLTGAWGACWMGYGALSSAQRHRWFLLMWGALGLAVMTRGLTALLLTAVIVTAYAALTRNGVLLSRMLWWPGPLLFLALVLPWHIAVARQDPDFFHFYVVGQHVARLAAEQHSKPLWFYPLIYPLGMMFWGIFLVPALGQGGILSWHVIRRCWARHETQRGNAASQKEKGLEGSMPGQARLFLLLCILTVIVFFSLQPNNLVPDILPAYPPSALLLAAYLTRESSGKRVRWLCAGLTALLLLTLIPASWMVFKQQETAPSTEFEPVLALAVAGLMVGAAAVAFSAFRRRFIPVSLGICLLLVAPALTLTAAKVSVYRKVGGFIKAMPRSMPSEVRIAEWKNYDQSLSFYARRRTLLIDEVDELAFGKALDNHDAFFLSGEGSLRHLAEDGPLLVNLRPADWQRVRQWGTLFPVAANTTNVMAGNRLFFDLMGLAPWRELPSPPRLLLPRLRQPEP